MQIHLTQRKMYCIFQALVEVGAPQNAFFTVAVIRENDAALIADRT